MKKSKQNLSKYLSIKDSIQDEKINIIIEKIKDGEKLNKSELNFLSLFDKIIEHDLKDYSHLSKNMVVDKMLSIFEKGIKAICDLTDRDGKISEEIISIKNDFFQNTCKLKLKNGNELELFDKFLYNLTYSITKHEYSLTIQDEYFEKIFKEKDED